jgi:hypothetical protein
VLTPWQVWPSWRGDLLALAAGFLLGPVGHHRQAIATEPPVETLSLTFWQLAFVCLPLYGLSLFWTQPAVNWQPGVLGHLAVQRLSGGWSGLAHLAALLSRLAARTLV